MKKLNILLSAILLLATSALASGPVMMGGGGATAAFDIDSLSPTARWRAEDMDATLNDGDAVDSWTDRSANHYDVTQSTADYKPTLQTNEINGKAVIRFDGTNDRLTNASPFIFTKDSTWTIFAVFKSSQDSTFAIGAKWNVGLGWIFFGTDLNGATRKAMMEIQGPTIYDYQIRYASTVTNDGSFHLISHQYSGSGLATGMSFFHNGTVESYTDATGGIMGDIINDAPLCVGARQNSTGVASTFLNGDIAELIIFSPAISAATQQAVEDALGAYYAITITH